MQNHDTHQTGLYYIESPAGGLSSPRGGVRQLADGGGFSPPGPSGSGGFFTLEISCGQILSGSTPEARALAREGKLFTEIRSALLNQGYIVEKIY